MKKFIALVLVLALVLSLFAFACAESPRNNNINDFTKSHYPPDYKGFDKVIVVHSKPQDQGPGPHHERPIAPNGERIVTYEVDILELWDLIPHGTVECASSQYCPTILRASSTYKLYEITQDGFVEVTGNNYRWELKPNKEYAVLCGSNLCSLFKTV